MEKLLAGHRVFVVEDEMHGICCEVVMADWVGLGNKAGPIRNQQMLDEGKPDIVVAITGGRGTADMMRRARLAGVEVIESD